MSIGHTLLTRQKSVSHKLFLPFVKRVINFDTLLKHFAGFIPGIFEDSQRIRQSMEVPDKSTDLTCSTLTADGGLPAPGQRQRPGVCGPSGSWRAWWLAMAPGPGTKSTAQPARPWRLLESLAADSGPIAPGGKKYSFPGFGSCWHCVQLGHIPKSSKH